MSDEHKVTGSDGNVVGFSGGTRYDPDKVDPKLIQEVSKEQAIWCLEQLMAKLKTDGTIIFHLVYDIYPYDKEMKWRASGLKLNIAERNCFETDGHFTCDYHYGQYAREKNSNYLKESINNG